MSKNKRIKYTAVLLLILIVLFGCSTKVNYSNCPTYPVGGRPVGEELATLDSVEYADTWEWIGRIDKLRQELELCR